MSLYTTFISDCLLSLIISATTRQALSDQEQLEAVNPAWQLTALFRKLLITNESVHPFSHGKFVIDSFLKGSALMTIFLA